MLLDLIKEMEVIKIHPIQTWLDESLLKRHLLTKGKIALMTIDTTVQAAFVVFEDGVVTRDLVRTGCIVINGQLMSISRSLYEDVDWSRDQTRVVKEPSTYSASEDQSHTYYNESGFNSRESLTSDVVNGWEITLPRGTTLKVYRGDITMSKVDVIVNAANRQLNHVGGVAYTISASAGPTVQEACHRYVAQWGEVPETEIVVTQAGRLPYQCIIHAVGPEWRGPLMAAITHFNFTKTFTNILRCADELQCSRLAIPVLGAGAFDAPLSVVSDSLVVALLMLDSSIPSTSPLREIHVVDTSEESIEAVLSVLRDYN